MFSIDHFHYARWLSVHIRDLEQFENECPVVRDEFGKSHFVTQKTCRRFSIMAHDHAHELFNAVLKGTVVYLVLLKMMQLPDGG